VFAFACGGKGGEPARPMSNETPASATAIAPVAPAPTQPTCTDDGPDCAIAHVAHFQAQMCDCKDKACADRVQDGFTKWGTEMARRATRESQQRVTPEHARRATELATKYSECFIKLAMPDANPCATPDPCGAP
jgi:hypothetical protein